MHIWFNYIFNVWNDIAKIACSSKFECSDQVQKSILRSDCHTYQCLLDFKQCLHGTDTANIKRKVCICRFVFIYKRREYVITSAFTMNMDQYKRYFTMFIFSDKQNRESKMSDEEYEVESILQKRTKKGKVIALHCNC